MGATGVDLRKAGHITAMGTLANLAAWFSAHWGDVASLFGLAMSAVAARQAVRARRAATAAAEAAVRRLADLDAMQALTGALEALDWARRLLRQADWQAAYERCDEARQKLVAIGPYVTLGRADAKDMVAVALNSLRTVQKAIDKGAAAGSGPSNVPQLVSALAEMIDRLRTLQSELRVGEGVGDGGSQS